jgi:3-phenylpropionate/trans-cinnamate dioxygenase ferredoxin subunit
MAEWIRVADAAAIPPGEKLRVTVGGVDIGLFNVDGTLYAMGDTCTHAEASLTEGEFYDTTVECPLHGSPFDVTTGRARGLPALGNSGKYAVQVAAGGVYVDPTPVTPRVTR